MLLVELIHKRGRLPLQELPVIIPSEQRREQVLAALRVAQIIDVRPSEGVAWLHIGCLAPPELAPEQPATRADIEIINTQRLNR